MASKFTKNVVRSCTTTLTTIARCVVVVAFTSPVCWLLVFCFPWILFGHHCYDVKLHYISIHISATLWQEVLTVTQIVDYCRAWVQNYYVRICERAHARRSLAMAIYLLSLIPPPSGSLALSWACTRDPLTRPWYTQSAAHQGWTQSTHSILMYSIHPK